MCDDKGIVLAKFASFVGIRDSNEANLLTIDTTLELSLEKRVVKGGEANRGIRLQSRTRLGKVPVPMEPMIPR